MLVHALVFHDFIQFTSGVIKAMFTLYQADMKSCLVSCRLHSWRYSVGARLKFWRRSRVPKKGSRDEAVEIPPARKPRYFE